MSSLVNRTNISPVACSKLGIVNAKFHVLVGILFWPCETKNHNMFYLVVRSDMDKEPEIIYHYI